MDNPFKALYDGLMGEVSNPLDSMIKQHTKRYHYSVSSICLNCGNKEDWTLELGVYLDSKKCSNCGVTALHLDFSKVF